MELYGRSLESVTDLPACPGSAFSSELKAVTAHEFIETTGTTRQNVEILAFGIGVLLGKAAVESLLESK